MGLLGALARGWAGADEASVVVSEEKKPRGYAPGKVNFSAYFAAMRSGLCGLDSSGSFSETTFEPL